MMKDQNNKRRSFLKHLLAGTAAVAGTAALCRPAKATAGQGNLKREGTETLYRESEHFKKYYRSLRF